MLSAREFTVGAFKDASPTSLVLPRTDHEQTVIIGQIENKPAAVFLSDRYQYEFFLTAESENWHGLIVPNVLIEVDETSCFDPSYGNPLGAVIRAGTCLSIRAKTNRSMSAGYVTLQDDLPSTGDYRVGFSRWHIVLGEALSKRVLWTAPAPKPMTPA